MTKSKTRTLTFRQQEAFRLVYIHGLPVREAARLMGCSPANVNRLLKRIKKNYPSLFDEKRGFRTIRLPRGAEENAKQVF